ncbi:MAG: hypothetical protein K2J72_10000, partial [Oscillospiraceae bacterium]|nr:hypothetical protein [Oscillospiraceae bacterium]
MNMTESRISEPATVKSKTTLIICSVSQRHKFFDFPLRPPLWTKLFAKKSNPVDLTVFDHFLQI